MSVQTFLIEDPRIVKSANNSITVGVKSGPASSVVQSYDANSTSNNGSLFNINIPSENTLVDRHILVKGTITLVMRVARKAADQDIFVVPSPFPFNQLLQSASMNINNSKVTVQTQDILNTVLKQFDQKYLSKHCQGSANYIDKYLANFSDWDMSIESESNPFGDAAYAEKDSDTLPRGSAKLTIKDSANNVIPGNKVTVVAATQQITFDDFTVTIDFVEPIFGLPTAALQENDGCYTGLNQIELSFQYTSFIGRCLSVAHSYKLALADRNVVSFYPDSQTALVKETARVILRYYSLHPSQYAKLSKKSVIPFDEMVAYKTNVSQYNSVLQSSILSLRQIPDKLYVFVRNKISNQSPYYSNAAVVPIKSMRITFNNVAGLLSEMSEYDLYLMSRRNGSQQTFDEFLGKMRAYGVDQDSIGSYVVIDCVRDLGLDDMLSASSLGQFSLQVEVTCSRDINVASKNNAADLSLEFVIIANYAGILITEQGSSSTMSGLLTKQAVLDAKSKGSSNIDYDDVMKVSGGNIFKQGKAEVGRLIKSERGRVANAVDNKLDSAVDSAANRLKTMGHDKLSKYY